MNPIIFLPLLKFDWIHSLSLKIYPTRVRRWNVSSPVTSVCRETMDYDLLLIRLIFAQMHVGSGWLFVDIWRTLQQLLKGLVIYFLYSQFLKLLKCFWLKKCVGFTTCGFDDDQSTFLVFSVGLDLNVLIVWVNVRLNCAESWFVRKCNVIHSCNGSSPFRLFSILIRNTISHYNISFDNFMLTEIKLNSITESKIVAVCEL